MRLTCPHLRERMDPCPKQLPRQGQSFEPSPKLSSRFSGVCARKAFSYDTRGAQACDACSTTTWVLVPQATRPSALTRGWLGLVKHKLAAVRHMASDFLFEGGRSNISSSTLHPSCSLPPSFPPSLPPPPFLHRFFQLTFPDGGPLHLLPATHAMQGSRRVISGWFHRPVPASLSELRRVRAGYTLGLASPGRAPHQNSLLGNSCLEALQMLGQSATAYTEQQIQVPGIEPETFSVLG